MSMKEFARKWKPPEERSERKREADHKASRGKDTPDSKGPGPNDWKKSATSKPKGC